ASGKTLWPGQRLAPTRRGQQSLHQPEQPISRLPDVLGPRPLAALREPDAIGPGAELAKGTEAEDIDQDAAQQICRMPQATGAHKGALLSGLFTGVLRKPGEQMLPLLGAFLQYRLFPFDRCIIMRSLRHERSLLRHTWLVYGDSSREGPALSLSSIVQVL